MSVRRVVRLTMRGLAGLIITVIVLVLVVLGTGPGHAFLQKRLLSVINDAIDGTVTIGSLKGALWKDVTLNNVELRTRDGRSVIRAEQVAITYALPDFLRGRFVFQSVTLIHPVIELEQATDGHWNVERLFRIGGDTTTSTARRPLVLLKDVTITQGTLVIRARGAQDTLVSRAIEGLTTDLARLRVSDPDSTAIVADIRRLVANVDNPRLDLRNADGTIALDGDSLMFELDHVKLPATEAALNGRMRWGGPHIQLHVAVNATPLSFADVRGIVPTLPEEGTGTIAVLADMRPDGTIAADIRQADLRIGRSAVRGKGAFTFRPDGNGTARNVDVVFDPVDFALLKPYVDSLPIRGLVCGRLHGDGALRDFRFDVAVDWTDEAIAAHPVNTVDGEGRLILGGTHGVDFREVTLRRADVDMRSVHAFAPSVNLAGRLRARGTLEGPWRAAQFFGVLDHYATDSAQASTIHGAVKLGIGDTTRVDAEVDVDSLSMNLLRRTYPAIPVTGILRGRIVMHGALDSLNVDAALAGSAGRMTAQGLVRVQDSAVVIAMGGTFDSLNLHGMREVQPPSELAGSWRADFSVPGDSTKVATGVARLDLSGVTIGSVALGPGLFVIRLEPDRIAIEEGKLAFNGGGLEVSGAIGRGDGDAGTINFAAHADTIGYLEPLVRFFATTPDDSTAVVKLDGRGTVNASISGTTRAFTLEGDAAVDGVRLLENFGREIKVHARVVQGPAGLTLAVNGSADTVRIGSLGYKPVEFQLAGRVDSLTIGANVGFLENSRLRTRFETWTDSTHRDIRVDSLYMELPVRRWTILAPFHVHLIPGTLEIDSVDFRAEGTGFLVAAGRLSREGVSDFRLHADSVALEDIYSILQRDTAGVKGAFSANARINGPARSPAMELTAQLAQGRIGEYTLPRIDVRGDYENRKLTLNGTLTRRNQRIVTVEGSVPLDLSLQSVAQRELDGPINIVAHADTLDMRVFNAITSSITGVSGTMGMNVVAGGTWRRPVFSGYVDIHDGTVQVPAIAANYSGMEFRLESEGENAFRLARGQIRSGNGTLDLTGGIRFGDTESPGLTHPRLDMQLRATQFAAFNIRGFGAITASGGLRLSGPLLGATLTGSITADQGTLQFANLVQKRIVSLDDPEFRAMVDSNLAGADLAPGGHQIFFDSLRIENVSLEMGPDVWLRSSEANIQIGGNLRVSRSFADNLARYRIDGTLRALRGNYKLAIGLENSPFAVTRDFRVTRGTVRFFGTPDMNPEMDVAAEYVTRTVQRQPLTVRAVIEGTLLYPRLRLETDSPLPLTETEIASYLMFGTPSPDFGGGGLGSQAAVVFGGALGGVGQALASEIGLPLNYLTITPGTGSPTSRTGIAASRIEAGVQLSEKTFLTVTAGLCELKAGKAVGAAIEQRLSDNWSLNAAFEPVVVECGVAAGLVQLKYQFGLDLFWQQGGR